MDLQFVEPSHVNPLAELTVTLYDFDIEQLLDDDDVNMMMVGPRLLVRVRYAAVERLIRPISP